MLAFLRTLMQQILQNVEIVPVSLFTPSSRQQNRRFLQRWCADDDGTIIAPADDMHGLIGLQWNLVKIIWWSKSSSLWQTIAGLDRHLFDEAITLLVVPLDNPSSIPTKLAKTAQALACFHRQIFQLYYPLGSYLLLRYCLRVGSWKIS